MFIRLFLVVSMLTFAGCATNPMRVAPQQAVKPAQDDKSQVFFMRSSFVGSAIGASLYEVTGGDIKFIGVIVNGAKVAYETTPGKHVFMVVSEAADFMEADLAPGKNYFSIATPRMGAWKARFSLWPIKNDPDAKFRLGSSDFDGWVEGTKMFENSEKSLSWYENNKASVRQKYEEYWPVWQNKSASDIAERTLDPEDGR